MTYSKYRVIFLFPPEIHIHVHSYVKKFIFIFKNYFNSSKDSRGYLKDFDSFLEKNINLNFKTSIIKHDSDDFEEVREENTKRELHS